MELSCDLCLGSLSAPIRAASLFMNIAEEEWRRILGKASALQSLSAYWEGGCEASRKQALLFTVQISLLSLVRAPGRARGRGVKSCRSGQTC